MEFFVNILISSIAFMLFSMFFVSLVHEIGHYLVARYIMKEPNVKINMGFAGKPIINTKRFRVNSLFFFGGYVGEYSDGEAKKSHMIILFSAGALFTILLAIPFALYVRGSISLGDFVPFIASAPIRDDLFSVPMEIGNAFTAPWLSLATPLDFFNMIMLYIQFLIPIFIAVALVPYMYPLKLHGKWHWNPSDGLWILKFIFNKVSEKDMTNAAAAINENTAVSDRNKFIR